MIGWLNFMTIVTYVPVSPGVKLLLDNGSSLTTFFEIGLVN